MGANIEFDDFYFRLYVAMMVKVDKNGTVCRQYANAQEGLEGLCRLEDSVVRRARDKILALKLPPAGEPSGLAKFAADVREIIGNHELYNEAARDSLDPLHAPADEPLPPVAVQRLKDRVLARMYGLYEESVVNSFYFRQMLGGRPEYVNALSKFVDDANQAGKKLSDDKVALENLEKAVTDVCRYNCALKSLADKIAQITYKSKGAVETMQQAKAFAASHADIFNNLWHAETPTDVNVAMDEASKVIMLEKEVENLKNSALRDAKSRFAKESGIPADVLARLSVCYTSIETALDEAARKIINGEEKLPEDKTEAKNAIKARFKELVDGFIGARDKVEAEIKLLTDKAFAAGYTRRDFGRLDTAADLLSKAENISRTEAFEQVVTRGSAANLAMHAGSPCMKDVDSFRSGYSMFKEIADRDTQNLTFAKELAAEENAEKFKRIADNLEYKFRHILDNAETLRAAAKLPADTLDKLREKTNSFADRMKQVSEDIASGKLKGGKAIFTPLFADGGIFDIVEFALSKVCRPLEEDAKNDPAIAEFKEYVGDHIKGVKDSYEKLKGSYQKAVVANKAEPMRQKLIAAAQEGGTNAGRKIEIPKAILDNLEEALLLNAFEKMENIDKFCDKLKERGDAALRFNADQKQALRELVEKAVGKGPKVEKMLQRLVEQFETAFFADELTAPTNFGKETPTKPEIVLNHFKSDPDALRLLEIGFQLDTVEDVETAKAVLKERITEGLNTCLGKEPTADTSLSSGMMPVGVREYNPGYVTFEGRRIPNAQLGTKFPALILFNGESAPSRYGYAEFLEEKFDAKHTKMRQFVSFVCSMSCGLGGEIDGLIDHGAKKAKMKAPPRFDFYEKGTVILSALRHPDDNYNIEISKNGDVTIRFTHIARNKVSNLTTLPKEENGAVEMYASDALTLGQNLQGPIISEVKITATMTIKNATDAELGDKMPEFEITGIMQEEV